MAAQGCAQGGWAEAWGRADAVLVCKQVPVSKTRLVRGRQHTMLGWLPVVTNAGTLCGRPVEQVELTGA